MDDETKLMAALLVLRDIEWSGTAWDRAWNEVFGCPTCGVMKAGESINETPDVGKHKPDCRLAKVLAGRWDDL